MRYSSQFYHANLIITCFVAIAITGCNKNKDKTPEPPPRVTTEIRSGLPDNSSSINGYLYADYWENYYSGQKNMTTYCVFRDPAKNIMQNFNHYTGYSLFTQNGGNINVGNQIDFNGRDMNISNSGNAISYYSNMIDYGTGQPNYAAYWSTEGNGIFKPIKSYVPRGFPKVTTQSSYTVSLNSDFTLDINSLVSNYDSLYVKMGNYGSNSLTKRLKSGTTTLTFTRAELSNFYPGSNTQISFYAFNYSNQIIEDKIYVFELGYKVERQAYIPY
jgi:hypothetical protein